jgi:hypothetical protein
MKMMTHISGCPWESPFFLVGLYVASLLKYSSVMMQEFHQAGGVLV